MCLFGTGGSSNPTEPRNDVTHEWTDARGSGHQDPDKWKSGAKAHPPRRDVQGRAAAY